MTTATKSTKTTKTTKTQPTQPTQPTATDLIAKLNHLPLIQTKHLTQLFGFNDGGKYLRRHLRKHFVDSHLWGDSWVWKSTDKQLIEIIEYFTDNVGVFNETKRGTIDSLSKSHDLNKLEIK